MAESFMHVFVVHRRNLYIAATAALILFSGFFLFQHLGIEPFQDYDEATYAEVTRESVAHGNYASFTYLNNPFYKKPPLLTWITISLEKVIPHEELAMRLPSAIAAFALIFIVLGISIEVGMGWGTGIFAGVILATTAAAMEPARQARYDTLISLFITASLYSCIRGSKNPQWYVAMGASIGLAILTKNVIAIFAIVAVLVYLLSQYGFRFLTNSWIWLGALATVVVAAPWHIYMSYAQGAEFWQSYLISEVFNRAGTNLFVGESMLTTNTDYIRYFFSFAAPWSYIFIFFLLFLPFAWKYLTKNQKSTLLAALCAVAAIATILLLSKTKAVTYIIPLYPFMSISIALIVGGLWKESRYLVRALLLGIGIAVVIIAAFWSAHAMLHRNPYYSLPDGLARDEYAISNIINEKTSDPYIYTYKSTTLGSIQYYTRLPFKPRKFVYMLESATSTPSDSFVLTTVSEAELSSQFPQFTFAYLYSGKYLSLLSVQ